MSIYQGFVFNEGTDWATTLKEGYKGLNTSYDRAEDLEQENDKTRVTNAEYPLKIFEELIDLSPTIAKGVESVNKKRRDRMRSKGWGDIDDEKVNSTLALIEDITKVGAVEKSVVAAALKEGDNRTIQTMGFSGAEMVKAKLLSLDQLKLSLPNSLNSFIAQNYPEAFTDVAGYTLAHQEWKDSVIGNLDDAGFDDKFSKSQLKETFDTIQETFLSEQNTKLTGINFNKTKGQMVDSVVKALAKPNPIDAFAKESEYYSGFFVDDKGKPNLAKANRSFLNIGMMGVEEGIVNIDKFESVVFGKRASRGDKVRALIDKVGGGPEHRVWAEGIINRLEVAKKKVFENINTDNNNYAKNYEIELRKLNGNGEMSKEDLINYLYVNPETRWDHTTGNIPQTIKGMLSADAQDDAILVPLLDKKEKLGILLKSDVMKLNSRALRQQYLPNAISTNNMGMTQQMQQFSKEAIKTMADFVEKDSMGKVEKSPRWLSIKQQAELLYPSYYAQEIKTATGPSDAHVKVMARLTAEAGAGNFDTWSPATTRTLKLQSAVEYLGLDKDYINTKVIPGFESYIEQAINLPEGSSEVLLPFKQLGDKIGVPGALIQYNQVAVAKALQGQDLPIKSDVVLAYEKLTEEQQTLLGKHPTQAKVNRAKFLAFMEDSGEGEGVITWNELETMHEDVANFIFKEENPDTDLPVTPQLGEFKLRKGEWKKLPGATRIGYAVWDGKEWVYSQSKGTKGEAFIDPTDYKDRDGYYRPFEGKSNDLTTTFFGGDEPINTAEEGGPRAGDWYKTTNKNLNAMNLGDIRGLKGQPFVVWNGKEWVPSAVKGRFSEEYQGPQPLSTIQEEEDLIKKQAQNNY